MERPELFLPTCICFSFFSPERIIFAPERNQPFPPYEQTAEQAGGLTPYAAPEMTEIGISVERGFAGSTFEEDPTIGGKTPPRSLRTRQLPILLTSRPDDEHTLLPLRADAGSMEPERLFEGRQGPARNRAVQAAVHLFQDDHRPQRRHGNSRRRSDPCGQHRSARSDGHALGRRRTSSATPERTRRSSASAQTTPPFRATRLRFRAATT